ncbi:MAG: LLM class flavin-dependent oxidoreductase [Dehalococcoidia bacterium]|nr:LLM class flavin-dependent oxidoreductase [Dehalococcoidia bacterium]
MTPTGIVLYHGIDSGPELAGYGRMAEDAGFDSLWVTERYFHEETSSMLGYLAATTEQIRLGVGVVNPFTRSPALLGMGAATLDRLSGGRMMLGLGRSDADVIHGRMGIDYRTPLARLRGTVSALQSMWDGDRVSAEYAGVRLSNVGLAIRPMQERLPIYLAAIGPRALRLAGEVADGVLLNAYAPVEYIRWASRVVRESAEAAGRDPASIDITCMLIVRLTDDPDAMVPSLQERVARLIAEPFTGEALLGHGGFDPSILGPVRQHIESGDESGAAKYVSEELARACYLLGDATECRRRIQEYIDSGVDTPLLLPRLEAFHQTCQELAP